MAALVNKKVKIAKRKRYTLAQHSTRRAPSHFFFSVSLFISFFFLSLSEFKTKKYFFISVDS